ncbi:E3 ubiquitin ligase RNF4 [Morus notabilis]|uniref:E3 ubiquitin ligase RNF4 n=1 Tax=Morus notabilis TaxID=981085 RepID=W9R1L3_9ROSA|nr:E3 ubiquitin-protein ligase RNF4 [Morus notabilis]EXB51558.1 E3 ubiquitin ligase RNF4 [Morus notabilis]
MSQPSGSLSFDDSMTTSEIQQRLGEEMSDSQRGKKILDLDLNDPPVPSDYGKPQAPQNVKDFEVIDDDVVIISPTMFAEAKNNSSRNLEVTVVTHANTEVNNNRSEASTSYPVTVHRNKRRRLLRNQAVLNWEIYMNSEDSCKVQTKDDTVISPSEALSFNCPICIGPMSEETSTKCGHIFCKKCIEAAIKVQRKCPTCRHKLRMKDIIRIYLPTSI